VAGFRNRSAGRAREWKGIDGKDSDSLGKCARRRRARGDVVPHILRHTSATWLMQGDSPLSDAAGFLGMSEQTLREHYWHHHPDFQDGVDEAFVRSRERARNTPKNAHLRARSAPSSCSMWRAKCLGMAGGMR